NDIAALAGNGPVVSHPGRRGPLEAIGSAIEEVLVADVQSGKRQHAGHVHRAPLVDDNAVRVDDHDMSSIRSQLPVDGGWISSHNAVQDVAIRALLDVRHLSAIDG